MSNMFHPGKIVLTVLVVALVARWGQRQWTADVDAGYPRKPIRVVVPYKPGGGSDTFVRIVEKGIVEDELLSQPLAIENKDGGIGTIGSRSVKNAKPDGYKILCHHNAIITAKLTGTVNYGPEAFEPIALTGEMAMVVLVRADSEVQNIVDLLELAKQRPKEIRFGANKGAPAYFTTLQLERALPGADFSIVSAGGGADRCSKILGGHLDAGIFSLSEYLDFRRGAGTPDDQNIRAIVVLEAERHEAIPEVPTAVELGIPVQLTNANYWWAPKGTPDDVIEKLVSVLRSAMENETVREKLQQIRVKPTFDHGQSFKDRLGKTVDSFEGVTALKKAELPNFALYAGCIVSALLLWVLVDRTPAGLPGESVPIWQEPHRQRPWLMLACAGTLAAFVLLLGWNLLPFAILASVLVMATGGLMLRGTADPDWLLLIQLGLLTGFGAQFIFTELFVGILP